MNARRRCFLAAPLALLILVASAGPARALLDPSAAQGDVQAAQKEREFPFCSAPRQPLSSRARALCPAARDVPGCDGFASACAKLEAPTTPSNWNWLHWLALGGVIARVLVWILIAAVALAVIVPIAVALVRLWRDRRDLPQLNENHRADKNAPAPSEASALLPLDAAATEEDLLGRAQAMAARGEHAMALQLYLAASLHALDQRGALRLARDRTNGEYVRLCSDAAAKKELRDIVQEVDRVQFGREDATAESVARAAAHANAIVRAALPGMLVLVVLAMMIGCSGLESAREWAGRTGDDPAGDELFDEMLRRQGVPTKALDSSLASLPLPEPGKPSPGVIVDVERIALDDDTRSHLVEWVNGGGVLVLVGSPETWPTEFGMAVAVTATPGALFATEAEETASERGALTGPFALRADGDSEHVAWFSDDATYAAVVQRGKGSVLGIASDELFTNVALLRPDNASVLALILSSADCTEFRIAHPEDGFSQPSSPIAALTRAGLGLGLIHGLVAVGVLFAAVGIRMMRAKPAPVPPRRAFAEHVHAVGALYARTRSAPHALAVYARFADERLRARMPSGTNDVVAFLASRAHQPIDVCRRVWDRAMRTQVDQPPVGDELSLLRELSAIYAAATAQDR